MSKLRLKFLWLTYLPDLGLNTEKISPHVSVAVLAPPTADDAFSACWLSASGFFPKANPPKDGLGGSAAAMVVAGAKLPKRAGGGASALIVATEPPKTKAPATIIH